MPDAFQSQNKRGPRSDIRLTPGPHPLKQGARRDDGIWRGAPSKMTTLSQPLSTKTFRQIF
jgi:hypothetical protein